MWTTRQNYPNTGTPVNLRALLVQIERQRDQGIDLELLVDVAREDVDRHVDRLRQAVRERDAAAAHLAQLIAWHEELEAVAETFGPEIANTFVAQLEARG